MRFTSAASPITIPEGLLDNAVLSAIQEHLLDPDRLADIVQKLADRKAKADVELVGKLPDIHDRVTKAERTLQNLLDTCKLVPAVKDDPVYQQMVESAVREADMARRAQREVSKNDSADLQVTPAKLDAFRKKMGDVLSGDNRAVAKTYLQSVVSSGSNLTLDTLA